MKIKPAQIFNEGDTVILSESERNKHPTVYPIGVVKKTTHEDKDTFFIRWESGEMSANFDKDGKIDGSSVYTQLNMNKLIINCGKDNEKFVLSVRLKI